MTYEPGHRVDDFLIDTKIGTGAYSTEYAATDENTGQAVVLKVLGHRHASDNETSKRFLGVAESMSDIASPAVIAILATGRTGADDRPFLARAATDRDTLHDRIRLGRSANDDDLARVIGFLGHAMRVMHERGLTHRDIKAKTVLLRSGEVVPDVTFGILWEDDQLVLSDPCPVAEDAAPQGIRTDIDAACRLVAEAAIGRLQHDEESFSDLLVAVASEGRFDLAAALGSGRDSADATTWAATLLAAVPAATPTRVGRRAASALAVPVAVVVALLVALGGLALDVFSGDRVAERASTSLPAPTEVPTPIPVPTAAPSRDIGPADAQVCLDQSSGSDVPNLELESVTHDSVAIRWDSSDQPLNVLVNGTEVASVGEGEDSHMVDRLAPDSLYAIVVGGPLDQSVICAQTFAAPTPIPDPALAVPAPGAKVITID